MDKRIHFIWGSASYSKNRILLLKMHGMNRIFVLDKNQETMIKEHKDATHVSIKFVPLFQIDQPGRVHHFFTKIPSRKHRERIRKR